MPAFPRLAVAAASLAFASAPQGAQAQGTLSPPAGSEWATAICSVDDAPETGMQGETPLTGMASGRSKSPYHCGLDIVSQVDPWSGGSSGFIQRAGGCAYVHGANENGAGLAVVDLSNPARPEVVRRIMTPATAGASETLDVLNHGPRRLLIAGDYGGGVNPPGPAPMEIYDVSDCANPRLLVAFEWPAGFQRSRIFWFLPIHRTR